MTGIGHTPGEQCTGCLLTLKIFPGQEFCLSVSVPRWYLTLSGYAVCPSYY